MRRIVLYLVLTIPLIPSLSKANPGYALQFDGIDDYVTMGDNYMLANSDFTFEFWISTSYQAFAPVMGKSNGSDVYGYTFEINRSSGKIDYKRCNYLGQSWTTSHSTITDGLWHHVAFVYENSTGFGKLIIDGNIDEQNALVTDIGISNAPFTISGNWGMFQGMIDEVRIWNYQRTVSEIQTYMHSKLAGNEQGLIGYWNFDGGQGDTAHDLSSSVIDGRLGNIDGPDTADPAWVISTAPIARIWYISVNGNDGTGDGSESNPFRTIQHGINVSSNSDTVLVAPGIYHENIDLFGKAIIMKSQSGAESTIIESLNSGSPIIYTNCYSIAFTVINGFTLLNALNTPAIKIDTSNISVLNNIFESNTNNIWPGGGGIGAWGPGVRRISGNVFRNNSAYSGGAINNIFGTVSIDSNIFESNNYHAVYLEHSDSSNIRYNLFYSNQGGLEISSSWNCVISNNTFVNNNTYASIIPWVLHHSKIINNIISLNAVGIAGFASDSITLCYNNVWQNTVDYDGIIPGEGSISVNPLFVGGDPANYHLLRSSPCLDVGDPNSPLDPDSTRADMGAYFFDQSYSILDYSLISPINNTIVNGANFVWHSTTDLDSGYTVYYKLYWDINPSFLATDSSVTLSDTFFTNQEAARSLRYYWKVEAFNYHALPIYSNQTWSFYLNGYPTRPAPFAPENGRDADSTALISWLVSTDPDSFDAVSYTIQIDNDSAFASPEVNQSGLRSGIILDDAFAIRLGELEGHENLQADTRYFWRVRADDNYGLSSDWTDGTNWFVYLAQNHPPNAPDSGFSPTGGEEVISLTPLITWANGSDPDPDDHAENLSYAIRLSTDSSFIGFIYYDTTGIGLNQIQPVAELADNTRYYYEIKTIDDGGLSSGWSARQDFWTNHYNFPPEPFPLMEPLAGTKQVVANTHFTWGGTVDYDPNSSFTYSIQFSPDSTFQWIARQVAGVNDTAITIATDTIALVGAYPFWRVVAVDDDGLMRIGGIPEQARRMIILPPGDANSSGNVTGLDVVYLVNYFKSKGPAPDPLLAGDANGSCSTTGLDVTFLVRFFKGMGPAPRRCAQ
jgi:parallel beta-helix repeat protein